MIGIKQVPEHAASVVPLRWWFWFGVTGGSRPNQSYCSLLLTDRSTLNGFFLRKLAPEPDDQRGDTNASVPQGMPGTPWPEPPRWTDPSPSAGESAQPCLAAEAGPVGCLRDAPRGSCAAPGAPRSLPVEQAPGLSRPFRRFASAQPSPVVLDHRPNSRIMRVTIASY